MRFLKGDMMLWKHSNRLAFKKLDDNDFGWWVSLDSTYLVERKVVDPVTKKEETKYDLKPESEKLLHRNDGTLNRFGFKWDDESVYNYYKGIMLFSFKCHAGYWHLEEAVRLSERLEKFSENE